MLGETYRAVGSTLTEELKAVFDGMGLNTREVIAAAGPFDAPKFGPDRAVYRASTVADLLAGAARRAGTAAPLVELACEANAALPARIVGRVADALNDAGKSVKGSRVLLMGVADRRDLDDVRASPGLDIFEMLATAGAVVAYHDPHVPCLPPAYCRSHLGGESVPLTAELLGAQDAVVVVADRSDFDCRGWRGTRG